MKVQIIKLSPSLEKSVIKKRISVPEDIYNQGCVKDVDEALEVNAESVGV